MEQESKGLKYLNIVNGSIQNKTYSFAIFTIIVVAILVAGAIRPTVQKILQINKEIAQKRIVNEQLANKTNALATLTNQYQSRVADFNTLAMLYPSQGNYSLLMSNIEEISQSNGYTLTGINFGSTEKINLGTNVLKPWSIRLSIKGSKANFVKYLQQLEEMPNFPRIMRVSFSNTTDKKGLTAYSVELLIYRIEQPNFYVQ